MDVLQEPLPPAFTAGAARMAASEPTPASARAPTTPIRIAGEPSIPLITGRMETPSVGIERAGTDGPRGALLTLTCVCRSISGAVRPIVTGMRCAVDPLAGQARNWATNRAYGTPDPQNGVRVTSAT